MLYLLFCSIAYILGIIWGLNYHKIGLVPIFLSLICMLFVLIFNKRKFGIIITFIFIVLFGFVYFNFRLYKFKNSFIEGKTSYLGEVKQLISYGDYYNKYLFINNDNKKLLIYIPKEIIISNNEIISFDGEFSKPSVKRNKGGFDYSLYLYSQNIYGIVYVKNSKRINHIACNYDFINDIRNSIINSLR